MMPTRSEATDSSSVQDLPIYSARRLISAEKQGSSRPVVIETDAGYFFTKLRGAAQGTAALIAEIIVGAIAEILGFWVPCRALISIDQTLTSDDHEDELLDLLTASQGINLGFQYLPGARDIRSAEVETVDGDFAAQVLWLDTLVMNVDRTLQNPNLMVWQDKFWVIDHGAALPFQYDWSKVSESSPRSQSYRMNRHVFWNRAHDFATWDQVLAAKFSLELLQNIVAQIPDCFLQPLLDADTSPQQFERRRQAYAAFLWKRVKAPRPFTALWLANQAGSPSISRGLLTRFPSQT